MDGGKRILMVENDSVILEAVADMLSAKDYQVTKARDGLEALERFQASAFDLAILDIVLPKIDGHDLCRLMRQDKRGRSLPIIAFTALSPQDVAKLHGLSADAYVAKGPLTVVIPNLLDAIKSVLTSRRGRLGQQRIFGYEAVRPRQVVTELFELNQYYKRLVHAVAEVVIELDPNAKILSLNLEALRLLGRSEAQLICQPFSDLLTPQDRSAFESYCTRLAQDPLGSPTATELTLAGTGRRVWCRPVIYEGEIAAFLVTGEA